MTKQISFFPGERIQGVQADYKIEKLIGSGATSNVFKIEQVEKPERKLVIKVMKQAKDKEAFRREAHLLRAWQTLAIDQPQLFTIFRTATFTAQTFGVSVPLPVPYLVEANLTDEPFYLITEHAIGQQVIGLLERNDNGLNEALVLKIGVQFTHLLHLLHTKLMRWFQDLKLENIWWDNRTQRIMVTDWNVVSQEGEIKVRRDLDRGSRFLFRLLTGVSLEAGGVQSAMGLSASSLERRAGQRWPTLTIGTRELLVRALHLNFAQRYQSSEELARDLQFLSQAFRASLEDLNLQVKEFMYFEPDPQRAEWLLHIMRQHPQSKHTSFNKGIEKLAEEIRDQRYGRTKQLLAGVQSALIGGNIQLAVQKSDLFFESSQEEGTKVQAMRWRQVVRLAEQGYLPADKQTIGRVGDLIEKGNIKQLAVLVRGWAIHEHFKLNQTTGDSFRTPTAVRALRYDARSKKKMDDAENSTQAQEKLKALRGLERAMTGLRYHDAQYASLLQACFGSYGDEIQKLEQRIFKLDELRQRAEKLNSQEVNLSVINDALQALREGFYLAPGDQELRDIACEAARFYLSSIDFWPYAVKILDATKGELDPDLIALCHMSQAIGQAKQALLDFDRRDQWIPFQQLRQQQARYKNNLIQIGKQQEKLANLFFSQLRTLKIDFVNYVTRQLNSGSESFSPQELKLLKEEAQQIWPDLPAQLVDQINWQLNSWIDTIKRLQQRLKHPSISIHTYHALKHRVDLYDQMIPIVERNNIDRDQKWQAKKNAWQENRRHFQNLITKAEDIQNKMQQAVQEGDPEMVTTLSQRWSQLQLHGFEIANDAGDRFRRAWENALKKGLEHDTLKDLRKLQKYLASMTDALGSDLEERLQKISRRIKAKECLEKAHYWKNKADRYWAGEEKKDPYAAQLALGEAMHWVSLAKEQEADPASEEAENAIKSLQDLIQNTSNKHYRLALEAIIQDAISINEQVQLIGAAPQQALLKQDDAKNQAIFDILVDEIWRSTFKLLKDQTKEIYNFYPPVPVKELGLNRRRSNPRQYILFVVHPTMLVLLYDVDARESSPALINDLRYELDLTLQETASHSWRVLTITSTKYPEYLLADLQAASPPIKEGTIDYILRSRGHSWHFQMGITFISL